MPAYIDILIPMAAIVWILFWTGSPRGAETHDEFLARRKKFRRLAGWMFWPFLLLLLARLSAG